MVRICGPHTILGAKTVEILGVLLAYMNPEATLPLASALAAIAGFILLFGRAPLRLIARGFRSAARTCRGAVRGLRRATRGFGSIVDKFDL